MTNAEISNMLTTMIVDMCDVMNDDFTWEGAEFIAQVVILDYPDFIRPLDNLKDFHELFVLTDKVAAQWMEIDTANAEDDNLLRHEFIDEIEAMDLLNARCCVILTALADAGIVEKYTLNNGHVMIRRIQSPEP